MFDFLKNLTKSEEEKRQEAFSAYLDDTLSPSQRREFEEQVAEDDDLRAEIELAQLIRQQMNEMPRRSLPRSFTLDPNVYGAPQREPLVQAYPFLRAATVLTAFFFVIALGLSVYTTQGGGDMAQAAMEPAPAFDASAADSEIAMEESAPNERIVEEVVVEGEMAEEMKEEAAAEMLPLSTTEIPLTKSTEIMQEEEMVSDADDMANGADAAGEAENAYQPSASAPLGANADEAAALLPTATAMSTATVSSLPRPTAAATAVPRAVTSTAITPPDEVADAIATETAVSETQNLTEPKPPRWSLSTSQVLLIGLGILLLALIVVTLLARRRL